MSKRKRAKSVREPLVSVTFRAPETLVAGIDDLAERMGSSSSALWVTFASEGWALLNPKAKEGAQLRSIVEARLKLMVVKRDAAEKVKSAEAAARSVLRPKSDVRVVEECPF